VTFVLILWLWLKWKYKGGSSNPAI